MSGDSSWSPGSPVAATELAYRSERWWHPEIGVRILAVFDPEPASVRMASSDGFEAATQLGL